MSLPRGIRNNNPGNLRVGTKWQGLAKPEDMTPEQKREEAFCVFKSAQWGIRAMVRILQTYRVKYALDTVRGIIERWAPPLENDTNAYITAVATALGVGPDTPLDTASPAVLVPLIKSIIRHENGQMPYDDATIYAGIALADIEDVPEHPASKGRTNITQSRTIQASGSQLVALVGAGVTAVTSLSGTAQLVVIGFLGVAMLGTLWVMRERIAKWAEGVR